MLNIFEFFDGLRSSEDRDGFSFFILGDDAPRRQKDLYSPTQAEHAGVTPSAARSSGGGTRAGH
jgi:hypothetical protein